MPYFPSQHCTTRASFSLNYIVYTTNSIAFIRWATENIVDTKENKEQRKHSISKKKGNPKKRREEKKRHKKRKKDRKKGRENEEAKIHFTELPADRSEDQVEATEANEDLKKELRYTDDSLVSRVFYFHRITKYLIYR